MVQYYIPHIYFSELFKIVFTKKPDKTIIDFLKSYTNKKYAILTGSCRSALYLSYLAIEDKGKNVITSPLTCNSAITPILAADKKVHFIDIDSSSFLIDANQVALNIDKDTIAIQAIHLGGTMCEMDKLSTIAKRNDIYLVEDCAQGFGAEFKGKNCGTYGDIVCFSLGKNLFGIGGGVLLTDNKEISENANSIQEGFQRTSILLSTYRLFRNLIETYRRFVVFNFLYKVLIKSRKRAVSISYRDEFDEFKRMIRKPNILELKVSAHQIKKRVMQSVNIRGQIAMRIKEILKSKYAEKHQSQKSFNEEDNQSFVKFYCTIENFNSSEFIHLINLKYGVELKHLEHKSNFFFQRNFKELEFTKEFFPDQDSYPNYDSIHQKIFTLPIHEKLSQKDINVLMEVIDLKD